MATTGIAAELLHEGTTVHRRLCKTKHVDAASQPSVSLSSVLADVINQAHVLIIDEISMQHKDVLEYVDRLLKSVAPSHLKEISFAGKVYSIFSILSLNYLGCYFGRRLETIDSCSAWWK